MEKITHVVDGDEYEIRVMRDDQAHQFAVGIFKDNRRVGPRYLVAFETASDFRQYTGEYALQSLVDLAKNDLDAGVVNPRSRVGYRGYVIQARPHQLVENDHWTIDVDIERHDSAGVTVRQDGAANNFPTKREAVQHCIDFWADH